MPEFCDLFIDHRKRLFDGTGVYIRLKGSAFKAQLDLFQELALDFISTMGAWDEPTVQRL
jgi:hypothetical protein